MHNYMVTRPLDNHPFDCTTFDLTVLLMGCACYGPNHSHYFKYLCNAPDIAAVGTFPTTSVYTTCYAIYLLLRYLILFRGSKMC